MSNAQINELLELCSTLPYGPQLDELLDQALSVAVESADAPSQYRVRLLLADACGVDGDSDGLLTHFGWCLGRYRSDPLTFPADPGDGADLLWQFKWMNGVLGADPRFPAATIRSVWEDMASTYAAAGLGQSAVATARFEAAFANGWMQEAAAAFKEMNTLERDSYSHCDACVRSVSMSYYFAIGQTEQGLACLDELLEGGFSCGEEPESAISAALIELLRAGRGEETKALHVRSYQVGRSDPENLGLVANHIEYLVVTGNLTRALAVAERHLPWLAHDPMGKRGQLRFLSALALLCRQLRAASLGQLPVRGSAEPELSKFFGQCEHTLEAVALEPLAWSAAGSLAAEFDIRNGNDWMSRKVQTSENLASEYWDLPWETDSSLSRNTQIPQPVDGPGWLRRAREFAACGQTDRVHGDITRGLQAKPAPDIRAGLHNLAMLSAIAEGNSEAAAGHLADYLGALQEAGEHSLAQMLAGQGLELHRDGSTAQLDALTNAHLIGSRDNLTEVYLGTWFSHALMRHDQFDRALQVATAALEASQELLSNHPGNDVRDSLMHNLYSIWIILHSAESSVAQLQPLVEQWRRYTPTDNSLAQVEHFLGQLAASAGDFGTALEYANRALDVFICYEDRDRAIIAADFSAAMMLESGETEAAKSRLRLGLHQASLAEDTQRFALLFRLAQLHVQGAEPHEAIDYLRKALSEGQPILADSERAELLDLLTDALSMVEQFEQATETGLQALELFKADGNSSRQLQVGEGLINAYLLTGHPQLAQQQAEELVELAQGMQDEHGIQPVLNTMVLLASVQENSLEGAAEATYSQAAALAAEHQAGQAQAQITVKHAQWVGSNGDYAQAVSLMLQAANHFEQLGQLSNLGQSIGAAASYLALDERHQEAVLLFEQSLENEITEPVAEQTLRQRLADSLDAIGETARALQQRQLAEDIQL